MSMNSLTDAVNKLHEVLGTSESKEDKKGSRVEGLMEYNQIFYGAPGTGKSYSISETIKQIYPNYGSISEKHKYVYRTTLHPEFSYSDFVGQLMPKVTREKTSYEFYPGVFSRALKQALSDNNYPVFLVIEELSRANAASVFGDLFQLLDRKDGVSEYSITNPMLARYIYITPDNTDDEIEELESKPIFLPDNLYILCTVNTNDQNVFVMDTAFKRRFEWKYISTNPTNINDNNPEIRVKNKENLDDIITSWHIFYQTLNDYITEKLDLGEDKQIGQFFIKFDDENDLENKRKIQNKLLQYLWEDVEQATFKTERLFSENINTFSTLYFSYEQDLVVFSTEFLSMLNQKKSGDISEQYVEMQEEFDSVNESLTIEDVRQSFGKAGTDFVNKIEEILSDEISDIAELKEAKNYNSLKYYSDLSNKWSGFMDIQKGTNNDILKIYLRKPYIEGEIRYSSKSKSNSGAFKTIVIVNQENQIEELKPFMVQAWKETKNGK